MITFWPRLGETESLFSISARLHHLSGNQSSEVTSKWLYGFRAASGLKEIPRGLTHFQKTTRSMLGPVSEMLRTRTVIGVHMRFLDSAAVQQLEHWCGGQPSAQKPYFGLRATGIPTRNPLRACPSCMSHDASVLGAAIWRVEHQLPGVLVCPHHGNTLLAAAMPTNRRCPAEHRWIRPEDSLDRGEFGPSNIGEDDMKWLFDFAKTSWLLVSQKRVSNEALRHIVVNSLVRQGFIRSIRRAEASALDRWWITSRPTNLARYPIFGSVSGSKWIHDLLLRRLYGHPLRWAVLCSVAMNPSELQWELVEAPPFQANLMGDWEAQGDGRRDILKASAWHALQVGDQISNVCGAEKLSSAQVRHALRLNPEMHSARAEVLAKFGLEARRSIVDTFLSRSPLAGRAQLFQAHPAALRWLEQHDRAWISGRLQGGTLRFRQRSLDLQ